MQHSYLLLFILVALASAYPLPTRAARCSPSIIAKYDDLLRQPPTSIPNPVSLYRGLKYNNFVLLTLGDSPAGIMPASSPNVVGFSVVTAGSTSSVTVFGGGAGYTTFKPTRIFSACSVGAVDQSVVNLPTSCSIDFSGYKAGVRVARTFGNYMVRTGEVNKTMDESSLRAFGEVDTITFALTSLASQLTVAVRIDNLEYSGCN